MSKPCRVLALIVALSASAACTDAPLGAVPQPGTLLLRLTTPHEDDGALMFEVRGPAIDSATAANTSVRLFTRRAGDSRLVGIVVGAIAGGSVVTLHVPGAAATSYTARIIEIADRHDLVRASLTGYAITVTP